MTVYTVRLALNREPTSVELDAFDESPVTEAAIFGVDGEPIVEFDCEAPSRDTAISRAIWAIQDIGLVELVKVGSIRPRGDQPAG